ncbi:MAG: tetratricopeptide repeat protein [Syntrophaceae bacterium]|nr:tetratricopeptide repeat protein [Syntrophaceae bacterium]
MAALKLSFGRGAKKEKTPAQTNTVPVRSKTKDADSPGEEWRIRGLSFLMKDDFTSAIEAFTQAVSADPSYGRAFHNRGFAAYKLEQFEAAVRDFDKAIDLDPGHAEEAGSYVYRGLCNEKIGRHEQAIEDMKLAVTFKNKDAEHYLLWLSRGGDSQR